MSSQKALQAPVSKWGTSYLVSWAEQPPVTGWGTRGSSSPAVGAAQQKRPEGRGRALLATVGPWRNKKAPMSGSGVHSTAELTGV